MLFWFLKELRLEDYDVKKPNDWYSRPHFRQVFYVKFAKQRALQVTGFQVESNISQSAQTSLPPPPPKKNQSPEMHKI